MSASAAATAYIETTPFDGGSVSNKYESGASIKRAASIVRARASSHQKALEDQIELHERARFIGTSAGYTADPTSAFSEHFAKLANLRDAERPSTHAFNMCWFALSLLAARSYAPSRVVGSAEGGLAICFVRGDLYGDLEFLDSGEILGVVTDRRKRPIVWEIDADLAQLSKAIDRIRAFIDAPAPSKNVQKWSWIGRWLRT